MIRQEKKQSKQCIHALLSAIALLFWLGPPGDLSAAETNRTDIQKTILNIKQKYRALAAKQAREFKHERTLVQESKASAALQRDLAVNSPTAGNTQSQQVNVSDIDDLAISALPTATEYEGRFAVGEELIYSLAIGSIPLGDIFAIKSATGVKVGLSEFFQLVDFAIDVDIDNASATGWYISQRNVFSLSRLNQNSLQVRLNNSQFNVPTERFLLDDDIYVELSDIADWFSVATEFDDARLTINLTTTIPFPIESQLQRRARTFSGDGLTESVLPLKDAGYQLFSAPLLDVQLSTQVSSASNPSAYSILSSQDVAYLSSQLFLSGNDANSLTNARLTLSRSSKQGDLLGPLKMTEYAIGDVTPVNAGGINTGGLGRGFSMSNANKAVVDNRRINLVGEVQIGWDVELYRNGILLDNRTNVQTGRYEFNDVDLAYGSNDFELVFYGPQGQIERSTETYVVDRNALEDGEGVVQFSVVDINRSVFGVGDQDAEPTINGLEVGTTYGYGVTDWLSLGLGASLFKPEEGENVKGLWLTSNLALGPYGLINSVFQLGDEVSGRFTQQYNFRTKVADVALGVSYRQIDTLTDNSLPGETFVQSGNDTWSFNMSGRLFDGTALPISYENTWDITETSDGNVAERIRHSIGVNTPFGSLSHGVFWQRNEATFLNSADLVTTYDAGGSLAYKKRIGGVFTQVFFDYGVKPVTELTFIGSRLNYSFSNQLNSQFLFSYDVDRKDSRYNLRLNWRKDAFTFSGGADFDSNDNWSVNLGVRFGLGYDVATDTFFSSGRAIGNSGAVVVRVFEDENLDQEYTEGEALLDNVDIRAVQAFKQESTSEDGVAVLKSLTTLRTTDIVVEAETFTDPTMMVASEGFAVAARRGLLQQFDIPVVRGGELDGVIYIRDEEGLEEPVAYVRLSLVNEEGEVISTTRSEYDGYYLFEKILPGSYQIRVDTSTGRQRGTTPERLKQVKISNRGDLILDVDLVLRQLKSADGYIASLGEFSSLDLLKVYFSLLRERAGPTLLSEGFYIESKASNRYVLGVKYAEGQNEDAQQEVSSVCQSLRNSDIDCKAESVEFEY